MKEIALKSLFKLDLGNELFQQALNPRSCGGGDEFKNLAKAGDIYLNDVLTDYFTNLGIINTGKITQKIQEFHNRRTLTELGKILEIPGFLTPIDANYKIQSNDIKESIESLIAASREINGKDFTRDSIVKLYQYAKKFGLLDDNPIGELQEIYQKKTGLNLPPINPIRNGGYDHLPLYDCTYSISIGNQEYTAESKSHPNKDDCKRDIARKVLDQIYGMEDIDTNNPSSDQFGIGRFELNKEIDSVLKISIFDKEILFSSPNTLTNSQQTVKLNSDTGESILSWAKRKGKKNPLGMLLLLSARLDTISGASWSASLDIGELTLLNLKIDDQTFFEIGFGTSKSKSKKNAALKILKSSNLYELLAER